MGCILDIVHKLGQPTASSHKATVDELLQEDCLDNEDSMSSKLSSDDYKFDQ